MDDTGLCLTAPLGPAHHARGALGTDIGVDSLAELAQVPEQSHATTCLWALLLGAQPGGAQPPQPPLLNQGLSQRPVEILLTPPSSLGTGTGRTNHTDHQSSRHFLACVTLAKA